MIDPVTGFLLPAGLRLEGGRVIPEPLDTDNPYPNWADMVVWGWRASKGSVGMSVARKNGIDPVRAKRYYDIWESARRNLL